MANIERALVKADPAEGATFRANLANYTARLRALDASINHQIGTPAMWRKPDILADCVLRLAQKEPSEVTGRALLDEDFLRAEGVTDFGGYACVPGSQPPRLSWAALGQG